MENSENLLVSYRRLAKDAHASPRGMTPALDECTIEGVPVELRYDPRVDVDNAFVTVGIGTVERRGELSALHTFMGINFLLYTASHLPVYSRQPGTRDYVFKYACELAALPCDDFEAQ